MPQKEHVMQPELVKHLEQPVPAKRLAPVRQPVRLKQPAPAILPEQSKQLELV